MPGLVPRAMPAANDQGEGWASCHVRQSSGETEWRIWPPRRLCPAALSRRRPLMPGRRMAIMTKRGAARRGQPLKAIVLSLRNLLLIS